MTAVVQGRVVAKAVGVAAVKPVVVEKVPHLVALVTAAAASAAGRAVPVQG